MEQTTHLHAALALAFQEDLGKGDFTTDWTVPKGHLGKGALVAKQPGIIAGLGLAEKAFHYIDDRIEIHTSLKDGQAVQNGDVIASVYGPLRALLSAERVVLNFMQRMSGIASLTSQFVEAVKGTECVILDTRKTAPGLRVFDKWAVRLGGGKNHRSRLDDMVLIKENHIFAAGGMTNAVCNVREKNSAKLLIEVEVRNAQELLEALRLNVDRILLDNMNLEEIKKAVLVTKGKIPLEVSGNVSLENVSDIARTGVNFISVGKLTHSVSALDISFKLMR